MPQLSEYPEPNIRYLGILLYDIKGPILLFSCFDF